MLNIRKLTRVIPRTTTPLATNTSRQNFHATTATMVKVGDPIPSVELVEGTPGSKVNLAKEIKGKGLIIGVPAAFSKCTSMTLLPLTGCLTQLGGAELRDC